MKARTDTVRLRRRDALRGRAVLSLYAVLNGGLRLARFLLWPRARPLHPRKICVYRVGNVGDIVCSLPALAAIHREYPAAALTLLTTSGRKGLPGAKDVFQDVDWLDRIFEYYPAEISGPRAALSFISQLRSQRFDIFIELPNDMAAIPTLFRNMLFARLTGAKWAAGWTVNTLRVALQQQSEFIEFPNEVVRLLQLVERIGISTGGIEFTLPIAEQRVRRTASQLAAFGLPESAPIVALGHGAKRPGNRWPAARFAEVGREFTLRGYYVLILGTEAEREGAEAIREQVGDRCINLAGTTGVLEAAAAIRFCRLLICNDSGLQHLASAVGTPCVAIFSYWQLRGKWWPNHPKSIVLQKAVPCHTCYLHACPVGDRCVIETSPHDVISAACYILDESTKPIQREEPKFASFNIPLP